MAINQFCAAAVSAQNVQPRYTPDISKMRYVLKIKDQDFSVPLDKPEQLWTLKEFNPNYPLVILITGWTTNFNDTSRENLVLDTIYAAYRCRGNVNFVVGFNHLLFAIELHLMMTFK